MNSPDVDMLIERYEADPRHDLSLQEWGDLLSVISPEYTSPPADAPAAAFTRAEVLRLYESRAVRGLPIKNPLDEVYPLDVPPDEDGDRGDG